MRAAAAKVPPLQELPSPPASLPLWRRPFQGFDDKILKSLRKVYSTSTLCSPESWRKVTKAVFNLRSPEGKNIMAEAEETIHSTAEVLSGRLAACPDPAVWQEAQVKSLEIHWRRPA